MKSLQGSLQVLNSVVAKNSNLEVYPRASMSGRIICHVPVHHLYTLLALVRPDGICVPNVKAAIFRTR